MGTRSLTFVYSEKESKAPLLCMYRQFDGYMAGHGAQLAEFLNGMEIVNGYGKAKSKLANGMGCLAAQLISNFKTETGNFYIYPVDSSDVGEEYSYHIYENRVVAIETWGNAVIFDGTYSEFYEHCNADIVS